MALSVLRITPEVHSQPATMGSTAGRIVKGSVGAAVQVPGENTTWGLQLRELSFNRITHEIWNLAVTSRGVLRRAKAMLSTPLIKVVADARFPRLMRWLCCSSLVLGCHPA